MAYLTRPGESDEELGIADELPDLAEVELVYRAEDPIYQRRVRGIRDTLIFSDFLTLRQYRRMRFYADYFRLYGVDRRLSVHVGGGVYAVASVTTRETEVLELVVCGKTNGEIGRALWISPATVRKNLKNVFAKLGVHTRTEAAADFLGVVNRGEDQLAQRAQSS